MDPSQCIPPDTTIVKTRCAEVYDVCISVEPVPFNKGFYAVDITYKFRLVIEAYTQPCSMPTTLCGTAIFTKKVFLYGSEGNSKTFTSVHDAPITMPNAKAENLPTATVQVVTPVVLDTHIVCNCKCCKVPEMVNLPKIREPEIVVTLGVFSIVQLTRTVSILIPVYDFCIPSKECTTNSEDPCEVFDKIKFPTDDFFPPAISAEENNGGCGCR